MLMLALFSTMLVSCNCGPAGQLALAAARASNVPRSIRAAFRNSEIGVARGFGKRSQTLSSKLNRKLQNFIAFPFLNLDNADEDNNEDERMLRRGRRSRFKLNDRELRISRGFGKRSVPSKLK